MAREIRMDAEDVKNWIRDNVVIETEYEQRYSSGNNVVVSLRFADEEKSFTNATVYIPDDE
jgi:hypothetical protein